MNMKRSRDVCARLPAITEFLESRMTNRTALTVILSAGTVLLICQLLRHYAFETPAYDLRIHEELVRNSLRGRPLYSDLLGYGFLGHHASFIFILLSPIYALWESPVWLLILQGVILMLGASFVWRLALHFQLRPIVAFSLLCTFFVFRGLHSSYFRGFHQEVLAMVFLLGFLLAMFQEKAFHAAMWGILSMSCREDVALFLLPIGIVLCFRRRTLEWGAVISCVSLGWLVLTYLWLVPFHSESGSMAGIERWQQYGDSISSIALHLITHPGESLAHVFNKHALKIHRDLCFLPLFDGMMVGAIAIPWIAYTTSSFSQQAHLGGAYAAMFLPFVFVGTMRTLSRRLPARVLSNASIAFVFGVFLVANSFRMCPPPDSLRGTYSAHRRLSTLRKNHREMSVLAQGCVIPHIGWPESYDMIGAPRAESADAYDIVILAPEKDPWPLKRADIERHVVQLRASAEWVHEHAGCLHVFIRKEHANQLLPRAP